MLRIWGRLTTINVLKVLWAADEAGVPYERIDAGTVFGKVDTEEYRRLNPNGRVPTIEDDGFVLWESNTIVRYLCARYGQDDLYPQDIRRRMDAERWMDWTVMHVMPTYNPAFQRFGRGLEESATVEQAEKSFEQANKLLLILDAKLAQAPYVAGDKFSMGDIPIGLVIRNWLHLDRPVPGLDHIKRWYERLQTRPRASHVFSYPIKWDRRYLR